jgi:hypothetical protein
MYYDMPSAPHRPQAKGAVCGTFTYAKGGGPGQLCQCWVAECSHTQGSMRRRFAAPVSCRRSLTLIYRRAY